MRVWTAHLRRDAEPVLLREGFSWGAFLFGPIWLAVHRAWIPAALSFVVCVLIALLAPTPIAGILGPGLAWLLGLTGRDMVRWSMAQRGYIETHVVVARNDVDALGRLLANRPDLIGRYGAAEAR
ncbi:MAG: DUF2628 domain-containing protein [Acetobacteraceae bacterium]|nr:DUF2628 domain-containing protein [Acetobacteraceae bacterium]